MTQWIIYRHTSVRSGKSYIGLTSKSMEVRWQHHCHLARTGSTYHFHRAINLYGEENWTHEVIACNIDTLEEAKQLEKFFIKQYDTFENGYNMTYGGEASANKGKALKRTEVYEWVHSIHGRRSCTIVELKTEFPYLVYSGLSSVADPNSNNTIYLGWQLFKEGEEIRTGYTEPVTVVYNRNGEHVEMTATEFCAYTLIPRPQVLKLFRGYSRTCNGWALSIENLQGPGTKQVYATREGELICTYRSLAICALHIGVSNKKISNNMVKYGKFVHNNITYSYIYEE